MTRRRRTLSADERRLWEEVIRRAEPLKTQRPETPAAPAPAMPPTQRKVAPKVPAEKLAELRIGAKAGARAPEAKKPTTSSELDKKKRTALSRGKIAPDARIDLHGMTLQQAHDALTAFVRRCHGNGCRLVLVITGKGAEDFGNDPMGSGRGVLRRQVPLWLRMPPLAPLVLDISQAHRSHGGSGAIYVYLRRQRNRAGQERE